MAHEIYKVNFKALGTSIDLDYYFETQEIAEKTILFFEELLKNKNVLKYEATVIQVLDEAEVLKQVIQICQRLD